MPLCSQCEAIVFDLCLVSVQHLAACLHVN